MSLTEFSARSSSESQRQTPPALRQGHGATYRRPQSIRACQTPVLATQGPRRSISERLVGRPALALGGGGSARCGVAVIGRPRGPIAPAAPVRALDQTNGPPPGWTARDGVVEPSEQVRGYALRHQTVKGVCRAKGCTRRVELDPKELCGAGLGLPNRELDAHIVEWAGARRSALAVQTIRRRVHAWRLPADLLADYALFCIGDEALKDTGSGHRNGELALRAVEGELIKASAVRGCPRQRLPCVHSPHGLHRQAGQASELLGDRKESTLALVDLSEERSRRHDVKAALNGAAGFGNYIWEVNMRTTTVAVVGVVCLLASACAKKDHALDAADASPAAAASAHRATSILQQMPLQRKHHGRSS